MCCLLWHTGFLAVVEANHPLVVDWWNWYFDQLLHHQYEM